MLHGDVGKKIRALRKENKDSLQALGEKIEYDWSNLSKVERGIYGASLDLLQKIIAEYDVNPKYFFGEALTESEESLMREDDLNPSDLKEKYNFVVDGVEATDEELAEAIRLIRYFRAGKEG